MESAAEHEDGPGGGVPGVAAGEAGGGSAGGPAVLAVDLSLVKQEAEDWWEDGRAGAAQPEPEVAGGWEVKEEAAEEPEVKEEKVEQEEEEAADWPQVKQEQEQEEEPRADAAPVHGEAWLQTELSDDVRMKESDDVRVKEERAATPAVGCKRKLAMSRCETCGTKEAKYRCPRCMRYSCSLPCVKKHKAELTCNGVRDKTAYISIQQFTEMNLLSDYRFLEDVARTADHISRDTFLKRPTSSKHMCFMKNRARRQGINLRLLPSGFTKRKENSTFFDKRVPEDKTINEILKSYIDPEKSDPVIRQRLKTYVHSQTGVQILMKVENMQQNLLRYHELDPYKSLLDNLKNKVIIEYPTLFVVLKGSSNNLKILHQVKSESATHSGNEN